MSKSVNLPLYDEFLKIFINHKIINWQAKHFWEKMGASQHNRTIHRKSLMYVGLRVLLRCKYLEIDEVKSSKKSFIYKETPKLDELRDKYIKRKLEAIFEVKKNDFLNQIQNKENNIKFIESILLEDETLEKYFINHKEKLENDIKNIKSNIKFMDSIMT